MLALNGLPATSLPFTLASTVVSAARSLPGTAMELPRLEELVEIDPEARSIARQMQLSVRFKVRKGPSRVVEVFDGVRADAFVVTGTGMPGLRAVCDLQEATARPAMNSNLCLAWACLEAAGVPLNERSPTPGFPLLGGWKEGITAL